MTVLRVLLVLAFVGCVSHLRLKTPSPPALPADHAEIIGVITPDSAIVLFDRISNLQTPVLYVTIDSPGGSMEASELITEMFKFANENGLKIVCTVTGHAYSGASWIFEGGCTERVMKSSASIMFHEPYMMIPTDKRPTVIGIATAKRIVQALQDGSDKYASAVAPRLGIPLPEYHRLIEHDWFLSATDAISHHAADRIIQ